MDIGHQCIDDGDQVTIGIGPEHCAIVANADAYAFVRYGALEVAANYFKFIHLSILPLTEFLRCAIQQGVDVFMPIDCSEALGEIYGFVDNNFVGNILIEAQLIKPEQENSSLHRIEL